jgi:diadenosine tetraphosphate (Ap4A) HIT family hydrolase
MRANAASNGVSACHSAITSPRRRSASTSTRHSSARIRRARSSDGHTLILPRRHVASYFDLAGAEHGAIQTLIEAVRIDILARDPGIQGFNIGINVGEIAGQTIFHCHVHLIPRRVGDVANPRGGVRAIIPGKALY